MLSLRFRATKNVVLAPRLWKMTLVVSTWSLLSEVRPVKKDKVQTFHGSPILVIVHDQTSNILRQCLKSFCFLPHFFFSGTFLIVQVFIFFSWLRLFITLFTFINITGLLFQFAAFPSTFSIFHHYDSFSFSSIVTTFVPVCSNHRRNH